MISFNRPYLTGRELHYIADAHHRGQLAGDGHYTKRCSDYIEKLTNARRALLTHSCTAALEMAALLAEIKPGDEVIMPSFTFVSTANAFVMRGGVPVFVDIRLDTLNLDEKKVEGAITARTKAIVPVHYAGVACDMDAIMEIAAHNNLLVIEDAAQGMMSTYKGRSLGSIGNLGAYSFHETKNVISGEGGALLVNDQNLVSRAEIIREKGTNRSRFFRGQVDKYTWVDLGSSYLPGEIIAAFLWAQMQDSELILAERLAIWDRYHRAFELIERDGYVRRPIVPAECKHNAHMYYLLLSGGDERATFIEMMREHGINCVFHYIPLHSSPAGRKYARTFGELSVTDDISNRIVRLPTWIGVEQGKVIEVTLGYFR